MDFGPIELLSGEQCHTGENPYYRDDGTVWWTDIPNGKLYRRDLRAGQTSIRYDGDPVGGFTEQADGSLLLFRVNDIALLSPRDDAVRIVRPYSDPGMKRFNDVIADPVGRVYAGTIGTTRESGGVYRVGVDGSIEKVLAGSGCANGMGFSPDEKTFYWTCSTRRKIFAYDYDRTTGDLANERVFYTPDDADKGTPDGLAIDADGNLWSARWGGHCVQVIDPDGKKIARLDLPAKNVSCCCFGGADGRHLFITTATGGESGLGGNDGATFRCHVGVAGGPVFHSKIQAPAEAR